MKIHKLSSRSSEQKKFKRDNINFIDQGVTRRLLEKYRPKHNFDMENIYDKKNLRRVA